PFAANSAFSRCPPSSWPFFQPAVSGPRRNRADPPMAQTLAEKIMSRLAGRSVRAGEFVEIGPDWTFSIDDGIGLVARYLRMNGVERVVAPEKIAVFYDHFAPADTPLHAEVQDVGRKLCAKLGITRLYDVGEGISHQVAVESALVRPGQMVTNTDS